MYRLMPPEQSFAPFSCPIYRLKPQEESGLWLTPWLTRAVVFEWLPARPPLALTPGRSGAQPAAPWSLGCRGCTPDTPGVIRRLAAYV